MPEYPEVNIVVKKLKKSVVGKTIKKIHVIHKNVFYDYNDEIKNLCIKDVRQFSKFILFFIGDFVLLSHLRMEGKYSYDTSLKEIKHKLLYFEFLDNTYLNYIDTRKFGRFHLRRIENYLVTPPLMDLGKSPYNISDKELHEKLKNKSITIKQALLNQNIISGIGNIYADEILFETAINPMTTSKKITLKQARNIINSAIKIFDTAIKCGGTTIYSYSSLGEKGQNQNNLKVHLRENKKCFNCNEKIIKIKINGRGTYYCGKCQK